MVGKRKADAYNRCVAAGMETTTSGRKGDNTKNVSVSSAKTAAATSSFASLFCAQTSTPVSTAAAVSAAATVGVLSSALPRDPGVSAAENSSPAVPYPEALSTEPDDVETMKRPGAV